MSTTDEGIGVSQEEYIPLKSVTLVTSETTARYYLAHDAFPIKGGLTIEHGRNNLTKQGKENVSDVEASVEMKKMEECKKACMEELRKVVKEDVVETVAALGVRNHKGNEIKTFQMLLSEYKNYPTLDICNGLIRSMYTSIDGNLDQLRGAWIAKAMRKAGVVVLDAADDENVEDSRDFFRSWANIALNETRSCFGATRMERSFKSKAKRGKAKHCGGLSISPGDVHPLGPIKNRKPQKVYGQYLDMNLWNYLVLQAPGGSKSLQYWVDCGGDPDYFEKNQTPPPEESSEDSSSDEDKPAAKKKKKTVVFRDSLSKGGQLEEVSDSDATTVASLGGTLKEVLSTIKSMEERQKTMEKKQLEMEKELKDNKTSLQTLELRSITVSNGEVVGSPLEIELSPNDGNAPANHEGGSNDNNPVVAELDQVAHRAEMEKLAVVAATEAENQQKEWAGIHRRANASFAKNGSTGIEDKTSGNRKTASAGGSKKRKKNHLEEDDEDADDELPMEEDLDEEDEGEEDYDDDEPALDDPAQITSVYWWKPAPTKKKPNNGMEVYEFKEVVEAHKRFNKLSFDWPGKGETPKKQDIWVGFKHARTDEDDASTLEAMLHDGYHEILREWAETRKSKNKWLKHPGLKTVLMEMLEKPKEYYVELLAKRMEAQPGN